MRRCLRKHFINRNTINVHVQRDCSKGLPWAVMHASHLLDRALRIFANTPRIFWTSSTTPAILATRKKKVLKGTSATQWGHYRILVCGGVHFLTIENSKSHFFQGRHIIFRGDVPPRAAPWIQHWPQRLTIIYLSSPPSPFPNFFTTFTHTQKLRSTILIYCGNMWNNSALNLLLIWLLLFNPFAP